jgi:hypothetical protein
MNTALIAIGSSLGGALVGGFAAAGGSDWAQRRQLRRTARFHMFDDLLPLWEPRVGLRVGALAHSDRPSPDTVLADLRRTAVLAGRRDRGLVERMGEAWGAYSVQVTQEEREALNLDKNARHDQVRATEKDALAVTVTALSDHLRNALM